MSSLTYLRVATLLGVAGFAFSGYLSATKMVAGVCAFDEPCPLFLGHPACYTGFALFSTAFLLSAIALAARVESAWPMVANAAVATAGTLFAGSMTVTELSRGMSYRLGLPTCAWGTVFFLALLVMSLAAAVSRSHRRDLVAR